MVERMYQNAWSLEDDVYFYWHHTIKDGASQSVPMAANI